MKPLFALPLLSFVGIGNAIQCTTTRTSHETRQAQTRTQYSLPTHKCHEDACARAVTGVNGYGDKRSKPSHLADCSSFLRYTVVPAPTTVMTTITVTKKPSTTLRQTTLVTNVVTQATTITEVDVTTKHVTSILQKRAQQNKAPKPTTIHPTNIPRYAGPCYGPERYSSACSCLGAHPTTTTAKQKTITKTQTVTATLPPKTNIITATTTLVERKTRTITQDVTTTMESVVCQDATFTDTTRHDEWDIACDSVIMVLVGTQSWTAQAGGPRECISLCTLTDSCKAVHYEISSGTCTFFGGFAIGEGQAEGYVAMQDMTLKNQQGNGGDSTETCTAKTTTDIVRQDTWDIKCDTSGSALSGTSMVPETVSSIDECLESCARYPPCRFANYELKTKTCTLWTGDVLSSGNSPGVVLIQDKTPQNQNGNGGTTCQSKTTTDIVRQDTWDITCDTSGSALSGTSMVPETVSSIDECLNSCARYPPCRFANYNPQTKDCVLWAGDLQSSGNSPGLVLIQDTTPANQGGD